jgi:hypothetical protein
VNAKNFEEVQRTGRSHGCPRCGAERNTGMVTVALQRLGPNGRVQVRGGRVRSKSISLCESCAVETQLILEAALFEEAKRS